MCNTSYIPRSGLSSSRPCEFATSRDQTSDEHGGACDTRLGMVEKWFKWKRNPKLVDAIIMYAQRGHGKRSSFYSDYTFGVFNKDEELSSMEFSEVPIDKKYNFYADPFYSEDGKKK